MSHCCSSSSSSSCKSLSTSKKHHCPDCNTPCPPVSETTILHHIKQAWHWQDKDQAYYFCATPGCDVIYFGQDNSRVTQSELRTEVGVKTQSEQSVICYCFGLTYGDIKTYPDIKDFVINKTKDHSCACETRNPSGKCCLKDFPKS